MSKNNTDVILTVAINLLINFPFTAFYIIKQKHVHKHCWRNINGGNEPGNKFRTFCNFFFFFHFSNMENFWFLHHQLEEKVPLNTFNLETYLKLLNIYVFIIIIFKHKYLLVCALSYQYRIQDEEIRPQNTTILILIFALFI